MDNRDNNPKDTDFSNQAGEIPNPVTYNPVTKSLNSFKEIGIGFAEGLEYRADHAFDSPDDFINYISIGMWSEAQERAANSMNSVYDFTNWLSLGTVDMVKEAFNPDDPLSAEHWANSMGLATTIYGVTKVVPKGKTGVPSKTPSVTDGTGNVTGMPPIVQSRINISNDGWKHVVDRHFSNKNASQFTISQDELRSLLSSKEIVNSPVIRSIDSADGSRYVREVTLDKSIGLDKFNDFKPTSTMTIITDKHGNLVTATPGVIK